MDVQYYIVGVRYNPRHIISQVRIWQGDRLFEKSKVLVLLDFASGYLIKTAFRGKDGKWHEGAVVQKFVKNGYAYLKTCPNNIDEDNLGELPEF